MGGYKLSNSGTISYEKSVTATWNDIWCLFMKLDGNDITISEIENAYSTIFTVS